MPYPFWRRSGKIPNRSPCVPYYNLCRMRLQQLSYPSLLTLEGTYRLTEVVFVPVHNSDKFYDAQPSVSLNKKGTKSARFRTSCAVFIARVWMKFSKHHGLLNLEAFHPL